MEAGAWFVAFLGIASLALVVAGKASLDVVGLALIAALVLSGVVESTAALGEFGNATVVTLAGLYVIGEGLTRTGAFGFVGRRVLAFSGGRPTVLLLTLCLLSAALSAVASNTAVMLVFIPIAIGLSNDLRIPASRLLIPMAFASIFGGTLTLVGSSINILTSGAAVQYGAAPIGMFEMTPIAAPLALSGVLLTVLLARRLLPDRHSLTAALAATPQREYVTELAIAPTSRLAGQRLGEVFADAKVQVLFLAREQELLWPPLRNEILRGGDVVMVQADVQRLVELERREGLQALDDARHDPRSMTVFELSVAPNSRLIGQRIGDLPLWRDYATLVVAVMRGGRHNIRQRASQLSLRLGDLLLVCGDEGAQRKLQSSADFFPLSGPHGELRLGRFAGRALGILVAVVAALSAGSAVGWGHLLPIPLVALGGAVAMVATGCIKPQQAYRSIDWPILIFIAGALALGQAMDRTGLAAHLAKGVTGSMMGLGPAAVVSGILLLGTILNQFTSPYAVTALLTPVALAAATSLGVADVRPFVLAVAFAGSNAFATPLGHQVNLMVMGPGGYRYADFVRLGLPLCLYFWVFVSVALAWQANG